MALTGSESRRAGPQAAPPALVRRSPASLQRKCRRRRRAPAGQPRPLPAPAKAAAAATGEEDKASGARPGALPGLDAPSCLERAANSGGARGLRGPGRPRAQAGPRVLRSELGSAPRHGRRHKFSPRRRRLQRSACPWFPRCSAAPGGGRDPRAHPGRLARTRCEPHRSRQGVICRRSASFRRAPDRLLSSRARQVPPPLQGRRSASQPELCALGHLPCGS